MIVLDVIGAGPMDEGVVDGFAIGMAANGAFAGVAGRIGPPFLARHLWGLVVISFHSIFRDTTGWLRSANWVCVRGGRKLMLMKGLGERRDSVEIRRLEIKDSLGHILRVRAAATHKHSQQKG
ncbi:MAG: hypothetical protein WCA98_07760 [Candidatus Acidiferrales bacterium]